MTSDKTYIAIDLKSFYASVECVERGLDPLNTNLVVADRSRTSKTICLAVSPSLKAYGIPGRARLFEVEQKVRMANADRLLKAPKRAFAGTSVYASELTEHPEYSIDFIAAKPRMALYMQHSARIYNIYLKYIAPEDIHVYSIDEVFIDVTPYLGAYHITARELAKRMIADVYRETGITATAGIGTNLYLAKIAMDIMAKKIPADGDGVRIAFLDEDSYKKNLWDHKPLTDFWRVGPGIAKKLRDAGIHTMGDIALCSVGKENEYYNEDLLYKMFGVQAEYLIDHAWGYEPTTIAAIKAYKPETTSMGSGQVLQYPYECEMARLVVREMSEMLALELLAKDMVTDQGVLTIGYDIKNLIDPERRKHYKGPVTTDRYGRRVPKQAHGSIRFPSTCSVGTITEKMLELYDRIIDPNLLIRRIFVTANRVQTQGEASKAPIYEQLDLFTDYEAARKQKEAEEERLRRERSLQKAVLSIKDKYGKNAILRGSSLQEGATARQKNSQIGGHHE